MFCSCCHRVSFVLAPCSGGGSLLCATGAEPGWPVRAAEMVGPGLWREHARPQVQPGLHSWGGRVAGAPGTKVSKPQCMTSICAEVVPPFHWLRVFLLSRDQGLWEQL